jgi:hypothetical protein
MQQDSWISVRATAPDGSILYDAAVFWDGSLSDAIGKPLVPGDEHYPIMPSGDALNLAVWRAHWWAARVPGAVVDVRHFE